MLVVLPYGKDRIEFKVDDKRLLGIISPVEMAPSSDPELEIRLSLRNPIESPTLEGLFPRGKTIAIAVDDITRVTPTRVLLPRILRSLEEAGARKDDIKIIIALGTHRRMTDQELKEKYGAEVVEEYELVSHAFDNESELAYLGGVEDAGLPIWINKDFMKAEIRITTGNIIPHFNAGWGAGAKTLLPGLAGEETVGKMHVYSAIKIPNALGLVENPTRNLIETFASRVGLHLIVNTAINRSSKIVKVFTGHFVKAHRDGVAFAKRIYGVEALGLADITISSSHPADIEFWQGQKGLFSADLVTKAGGGIVIVTPCPEGVSVTHRRWLEYLQHDRQELMAMYNSGAVDDLVALGLALNVAYVREQHPICIVSNGITDRDAERMGFRKCASIEDAIQHMSRICSFDSRISVLTHGGEIYPIPK
jgi:nickel-dependent lactate racemase